MTAGQTGELPQDLFDPAQLNAQLVGGDAIHCCKQAISTATDYMHNQFRAGAQAHDLIRLRASFIDALLCTLWDRQSWGNSQLAMVAVGGYGRGELHPHSDVDLLFLVGDGDDDSNEELSSFLTLLWDIGLDIGHSVRNVSECAKRAAED
ncbi:MAG: [protein-PII] uridylyltransferase, partial [Halieaceae bacterium]|nr:[protein-PII] uridylyltransferase [Halieaceae bacterium]